MEKFFKIAAAAYLLTISGCGNTTEEKSAKDTRLQYEPQVNKVEVMTLESVPFHREVIANGKLVARRRSKLFFSTGGVIESVNVSNGQWVSAGSVLAKLDDREKQMAMETARLSLDKAELDLYTDLAGLGYPARDTVGVPADILSSAKMRSGYRSACIAWKRAVYDLEATRLKAPFSGKVADLAYKAYDTGGSEALCTLIDDSAYDVEFLVFETELNDVARDRIVKVIPYGQEGHAREARIASLNPTIDKNGQILVKASLKGDKELLDGMNVRVVVENAVSDQLVVPKSAVVIRDNLEVLFRYSCGKAEWVYVHTLASNSTQYSIEANKDRGASIAPGDTVIISGNLNLADQSSVSLK